MIRRALHVIHKQIVTKVLHNDERHDVADTAECGGVEQYDQTNVTAATENWV